MEAICKIIFLWYLTGNKLKRVIGIFLNLFWWQSLVNLSVQLLWLLIHIPSIPLSVLQRNRNYNISCPLQYLIYLFQIPFTKVNPSLHNFEINEFHDFEESWFSIIDSYTIRKPRSVFMPSKVPFQVVYCSSSDDNHREKELEVCVSFFHSF